MCKNKKNEETKKGLGNEPFKQIAIDLLPKQKAKANLQNWLQKILAWKSWSVVPMGCQKKDQDQTTQKVAKSLLGG